MHLIELLEPLIQLIDLVLKKDFDALIKRGQSNKSTNEIIKQALERFGLDPCMPSNEELYRALGRAAITYLRQGYIHGLIPSKEDEDDPFTEDEIKNIIIEGETSIDVLIPGYEDNSIYFLMLAIDAHIGCDCSEFKIRNMFIS